MPFQVQVSLKRNNSKYIKRPKKKKKSHLKNLAESNKKLTFAVILVIYLLLCARLCVKHLLKSFLKHLVVNPWLIHVNAWQKPLQYKIFFKKAFGGGGRHRAGREILTIHGLLGPT